MRLKYAFLLSIFCVIILSCTDKKPVSQAKELPVRDLCKTLSLEICLYHYFFVPFLYKTEKKSSQK